MQTNHLIPVEDQYHLKFKLFRETETVWTDEDANPDVPVDVTLEFVSELDVTLSHADFLLLLLLLSEESHSTKSYSISLMAEALATMEIPESKHKHIIRSFLAHFKAKQSESPPHVVDLVITKNKKQSGKRPRFDMERVPYVCVTVARYKSELAAGRRLGLEIRGETTCAICREEFDDGTDGDRLVHLDMPCSHIFHVKCIDKWLETCHTTRRSHCSCPLCRFPLPRRFDHQLVFM